MYVSRVWGVFISRTEFMKVNQAGKTRLKNLGNITFHLFKNIVY